MSGFRIDADRLSHRYGDPDVLVDVCFAVEPGETFAIVGGNGVGKSTITGAIVGMVTATSGAVSITPAESGVSRRPVVAYLHQDYRRANLPWLSALENVAYPLRVGGGPVDESRERALAVLRMLIPDVDPSAPVHTLSGGQQQLVALSRALASQPDVMIADEPLSAADTVRAFRAVNLLRANLPASCTVVWVSHNLDEAVLVGDRIGLLSQKARGFQQILSNPVPRPRHTDCISDPRLVGMKDRILKFLMTDGGEAP